MTDTALNLILVVILIAVGAILIFFADQEIEEISAGKDRIDEKTCFGVSMAVVLLFLFVGNSEAHFLYRMLELSAAFSLAAMAYTDRQTAWVPNAFALPFLALSGVLVSYPDHLMMAIVALALPAAYLAMAHSFAFLSSRIRKLPPPADIMAFAMGPVLLGVSLGYAVSLILAFAAILLARAFPAMPIFHSRESLQSARDDLGYDADMGPAIPLLAVLFPAYLMGMMLNALIPISML